MFVFIICAIIALIFMEKYFKKNNKKRREYVKRTKDRGMYDYEDNLDDKKERAKETAEDISKNYFDYKEFEVDKDLKKFEKKLKELKFIWLPLLIIGGFFMPFMFIVAVAWGGFKYLVLKKRINKLKRRRIVLYNLKDD